MLKVIITNRQEVKELRIALKKAQSDAHIYDGSGRLIGCYFPDFGFRSTSNTALSALAHYYNLMAMKAERDYVELTKPTR